MWKRRSKRLTELVDQVSELDQLAAQAQDEDDQIGEAAAQDFENTYRPWYSDALAAVGEGLQSRLRAEFDGTDTQNRIRKFIEAPRARNPLYRDDIDEEVKASTSKWLHPYEETCRYPLLAQKQVLLEARAGVRKKTIWSSIVGTGAFLAGLAALILALTGIFRPGGSDKPPVPNTSQTPDITGIDQLPPCEGLSPDSSLAKQLRGNRQAVVDTRCYADPKSEIAIYPVAKQVKGMSLGSLPYKYVLEDVCIRKAEDNLGIADQIGTVDKNWVNFQYKPGVRANIPAIWTQGDVGADPC